MLPTGNDEWADPLFLKNGKRRHIWTPDDHDSLLSADETIREKARDRSTVYAKIVDSSYDRGEGYIIVTLRMEDGSVKKSPIHKSCFNYHGRPFKDTPAEEVDKEMYKLSAGFSKAKGRRVKVNTETGKLIQGNT